MASQLQRSPQRRLLAGLVLAVLCLVFLGWLSDEVWNGGTLAFDNQGRALIHQHASPALTRTAIALSDIGSPVGLVIMGTGVLAALWQSCRKRVAGLFLITMAGAFVIDFSLKLILRRTRPVSFFGYHEPHSYSFPSGHALFSVCLFGFLAAVTTSRLRRLAPRVLIWALAAAMALGIGLSRIYLGVHYPSDVAAGYAAAVVWVTAVAYGDRLLLRRGRRVHRPAVEIQR